MPSNSSIIKEIKSIDPNADTKAMNNGALAALLSELKASLKEPVVEPVVAKKPQYYMAPRKALTSKRGILSGDTEDEVKVEDLAGGQEVIDAFVKSGHILKG